MFSVKFGLTALGQSRCRNHEGVVVEHPDQRRFWMITETLGTTETVLMSEMSENYRSHNFWFKTKSNVAP